jgi:glycerol-3-phosphate acyltransferase PlsX
VPRIALDAVRAGQADPDVVRGALRAVGDDDRLELTLVGPADALHAALAEVPGPAAARLEVAGAARAVTAADDPVVAVRARRDASIRVAVDLVARGAADAVVSAGPAAATVAAGRFALGRRRGLRQPALAATLALPGGRLVVVDAGAHDGATGGALAAFGRLGADLAARDGVPAPRVAVLAPLGAGPRAVAELDALFASVDLGAGAFAGAVTAGEALHGHADVLVTGGAAGRILVDAVRAVGGPAASHALVVGLDAPLAVLEPAAAVADAVRAAVADVARLAAPAEVAP